MMAFTLQCALLIGMADDTIDVARIDGLLSAHVDDEVFSGEVLIAIGDRVLLHQQYGFSHWGGRSPLQPNSIFKIGSVTKQFIATAILQLEQQGRLHTRDPIAKHIEELPEQLTQRDGVDVTVHQLLTHTSGLPDPLVGNPWGEERGFEVLLEALDGEVLQHAPGAQFDYNNVGYMLLGEIIRRRAGVSLEQFLQREFFVPLGMRHTGIKAHPEQQEQFATGHVATFLGLVPSREVFGRIVTGSYDWDLTANGNVFSSVGDMHTWVRMLQTTPALSANLLRPERKDYAYGWVIKSINDEPLYWHNGAIIPFGYTADVGWTSNGLTIILLSNLDDTAVAQNVFDNVVRIIEGESAEPYSAGLWHNSSYGIIQGLATVSWRGVGALLFAAYLIWSLLLARYKSTISLDATIVGTIGLSLLVVAWYFTWWSTLAILAAVVLAWRARRNNKDLPRYHGSPSMRKLELVMSGAGTTFAVVFSVVLILFLG